MFIVVFGILLSDIYVIFERIFILSSFQHLTIDIILM